MVPGQVRRALALGQPAEPVGPIGRQDARQYNDIEATMDNDDDADDAPPGGAMKT